MSHQSLDSFAGRRERSAATSVENRIPSLDGIRALAIIMVVICHVQVFLKPLSGPIAYFCTEMAWAGVYLFFVLSGYLVGRLALSELAATNDLKISAFWARRSLRTWPLYFLALFANYWLAPHALPPAPQLWSYLTFTQVFFKMNYFVESWTLAVEEQFYFVLPLFLVAVVRLAGHQRIRLACVLVISLCYIVRAFAGYRLHPATTFDSLFIGVLLAQLEASQDSAFKFLRDRPRSTWLAGTVIFFSLFAFGGPHGSKQFQGYLAIGFGLILISALNPASLISRFLGLRLFKVIAISSYSTYLSHMFVIRWLTSAGLDAREYSSVTAFGVFVLSSVAALAFGWVVYQLIERPGLRLRDALVPRRHQRGGRRRIAESDASSAANAPSETLIPTSAEL